MDEKRLAEIEARANAATPGPWDARDHPDLGHRDVRAVGIGMAGDHRHKVADCWPASWTSAEQARANADFVAAARADVPDLAAEVRRLQTTIANAVMFGESTVGEADYRLGMVLEALRRTIRSGQASAASR
jgi:hypothetical protein